MIRFAASSVAVESFRASGASIKEFLGVRVSAETLRTHVEAAATAMQDWPMAETVGVAFAAAPGGIEFQIDAGKVNTQGGWRDFKICTFAKRPQADPATPNEWDTRVLPNVTARITVAALESIDVFEKRLRPLAAHLGIENTSTIHTLGDGAEWIWNTATSQFPGGPQTLDIYHGCEWISDTSKVLHTAPVPAAVATPAAPVEATPVEATPVEATPVEATPVEATPAEATPAVTTPIVAAAIVAVAAATAESVEASAESATPDVPSASATQEKAAKTAQRRSPNLSAAERAKAKQAKRSQRQQARSQKPKSEQEKSYERGREQLLNKGWQGICDYVAEELAKGDTPERRSSLEELMGYFAKHVGRLNYKERLSAGLVIGSGMVEGNVKTLGLRLKARGARWKVDNVGRMAALIGLRHSNHWNAYWFSLQASLPRPRCGENVDCLFTAV
jgi:hypothetical protein